jgi:hypothetical protein
MRLIGAVSVIFLAFPAFAQDEQQEPLPAKAVRLVEELVEQLGDEDPASRAQAEGRLVRMGSRIIPALRQAALASRDAEIRARALNAVSLIETEAKLSKVYREARRASLRLAKADAKTAFEEIERAFGVPFQNAGRLPEGTVSVNLQDATILEAMDAVCAQLKSISYDFDSGKIRLTTSPYVPSPRAYADSFRVRVVSLTKTVESTFDKLTASMMVKLAADWGPDVKPLDGYVIEVAEALGAGGEKLAVTNPYGPNAMNPMWQVQRMRGGMGPETVLTVTDLLPSLSKIASMKARATFRFPLENREIRIENPTTNTEVTVGEYKITVQNVSSNYVIMNISCTSDSAAAGLADSLDFESFEVIDKENNKEKAQVHPTGGGNRSFQFYVMIGGGGRRKGIAQITFSLREVKAMSFDFELKDIEIPR